MNRLDEFFTAFERATAPGPKGTRVWGNQVELLLSKAGPAGVRLDLIKANPSRQGYGSGGLGFLTSLADHYRIAISLEAIPLSSDGADSARLVELYKKFGFRPDYDFEANMSMTRDPKRILHRLYKKSRDVFSFCG